MRSVLCLVLLMPCGVVTAQAQDQGNVTALSFSRSMSIPLNGVKLYDGALEAWTWTFGKEPGAKVEQADRSAGLLNGSARLNFRSKMLNGREESMGTISYRIHIQITPGECRVVVSDLTHTGNRNTARGGIHLGQLRRTDGDVRPKVGMSHSAAVDLHREMRMAINERITSLLQTMEARIRAQMEP